MAKSFEIYKFVLAGVAVLVATFAVLGIACSKDNGDEPKSEYTEADMQAHQLPYVDAYINYLGTLTETKMSAVNRTGEVDFLFKVDDTVLDTESYTFDEKSFRFTGNEEEQFAPGINILQYPFKPGAEWSWEGIYHFGGQERKASAKITTSSERLSTLAGEFETILVVCDLEIESGTANPVRKELKFWFSPGKGLIQREIQYSLSREPMPDSSSSE